MRTFTTPSLTSLAVYSFYMQFGQILSILYASGAALVFCLAILKFPNEFAIFGTNQFNPYKRH